MGESLLRDTFLQRKATPFEHEIFRLSLTLDKQEGYDTIDLVRREVLRWARNRTTAIPAHAWRGEAFETYSAGRNCFAVSFSSDDADVWAFRSEDPDKTIAGRVWTTEILIFGGAGPELRISVRLFAVSDEVSIDINPHVPGLVRQLVASFSVRSAGFGLSENFLVADNEAAVDEVADFIESAQRRIPVVIATEAASAPDMPQIAEALGGLQTATLGAALVVAVPAALTWQLTERFGRTRSVFDGAVRVYLPGFSVSSDPYLHRLFLPTHIETEASVEQCTRALRHIASRTSVRANRLGHDVISFSSARTLIAQARQAGLQSVRADYKAQYVAAQEQVMSLVEENNELKGLNDYFDAECKTAEERAAGAEEQLRAAQFQLQQLKERLKSRDGGTRADEDSDEALPDNWGAFASWCDQALAGRVVLTTTARRLIKDPKYAEVETAARCLMWLAGEYHESRMSGANRDFVDYPVLDGIRNSRCGGDEFDFHYQGARYTADWHIKTGGTTRDPSRALRIYYCWEPGQNIVLVAEMPGHRVTSAT